MSREGNPKPHQLSQAELVEAGLTADTWRLEITAEPFVEMPHTKVPAMIESPMTLADGTALDLAKLMELGRPHESLLQGHAMPQHTISLGAGALDGGPRRNVLRWCGKLQNVRRIYYWASITMTPNKFSNPPSAIPSAWRHLPVRCPCFSLIV